MDILKLVISLVLLTFSALLSALPILNEPEGGQLGLQSVVTMDGDRYGVMEGGFGDSIEEGFGESIDTLANDNKLAEDEAKLKGTLKSISYKPVTYINAGLPGRLGSAGGRKFSLSSPKSDNLADYVVSREHEEKLKMSIPSEYSIILSYLISWKLWVSFLLIVIVVELFRITRPKGGT